MAAAAAAAAVAWPHLPRDVDLDARLSSSSLYSVEKDVTIGRLRKLFDFSPPSSSSRSQVRLQLRTCASKRAPDEASEGARHLAEPYIFEQRGSNLSKMRPMCQ